MNKRKNSSKIKSNIFHYKGPTKRTQTLFVWLFSASIIIVVGIFVIGFFQQNKRTSEIILSGLSGNNRISLTVNIGSSATTSQIVALSNAISENKIPCTFFISTAIAESLAPVWRAQIMNGNEIDYYYDNTNFDSMSNLLITNSFNQWEASVKKNIGSNLVVKYVRAGNSYDYKNIYVQTALYEKSANLIGWSIELKDMSGVSGENIKKIMNNEIIDGAIIKMDISDYNIEKLIKMLSDEAAKKNIKFVDLDMMFNQ